MFVNARKPRRRSNIASRLQNDDEISRLWRMSRLWWSSCEQTSWISLSTRGRSRTYTFELRLIWRCTKSRKRSMLVHVTLYFYVLTSITSFKEEEEENKTSTQHQIRNSTGMDIQEMVIRMKYDYKTSSVPMMRNWSKTKRKKEGGGVDDKIDTQRA